jgi:zinc and cadmium transporter
MSSIPLVGILTLLFKPSTLQKLLLPLVAFAAGSLLGGAFLHMIPAALKANLSIVTIGVLIVCGFTAFLVLEQFLHWRHNHQLPSERKEPLTYLVLIGDGLHNFLGGIAIAATFLIDIRFGSALIIIVYAYNITAKVLLANP